MEQLHIPQNGLNIDRANLPQIRSADLPDFLEWLFATREIDYQVTELPVAALHPSQGNFNETKIRALMGSERDQLRKPIVTSNDHFVADGHHRWLALLNSDVDDTIPAVVVDCAIQDLLAAMKAYPKSFTKTVVESFMTVTEGKEKHKVLAFGRMNPPTTGHAKLVDKVHEVAKTHGASHEVVLSHSQDAKKNPLSQEAKIKHAKRFFPGTNVTGSDKESPTIFHHAAKAHKEGVTHLHVVMGSDRAKEFHDALHKHNGKFDEKGHGYKFKSITVHSAGERDPDAEGTTGMSASKMREHASKGNYREFKKGIPGHVKDHHAKELYHDVRKSMGHTTNEERELKGKYPVSTIKKPDPKCPECEGTGWERIRHSYGTHGAVQCSCTRKINEEVLLIEAVHDAGIFKAVFLAGGPGSGKDFVLKKALDGHGLVEIGVDSVARHLGDSRPKSTDDLRHKFAIQGRNGLVINSAGLDTKKILKIKKQLGDMGYDSKMVFVDTKDDISRQRNIERGQRGGRVVPEGERLKKWRDAQDARVALAKEFGTDHYHEFNNDEDLRTNQDPEVHQQKGKELLDLFKTVKKFTQEPPKHPEAQKWIYTNVSQLAKKPVGNKKQQASVTAPHGKSEAAQEAQAMGLKYYGHGRFGKKGSITHFSLHDKLVEKEKALKAPKEETKKKLDEAFTAFMEDDDHGSIRFQTSVEVPVFQGVGVSEFHPVLGSSSTPQRLFETFRKTLVTETEATRDTGEEGGPILGMQTGAGEKTDVLQGGKATTGPVKKKTFQAFRKR